jgi:uncharacterized caspase-like protein
MSCVEKMGGSRAACLLRACLALCATVALLWYSPAEARRVALVIANSTYVNATPLPNPANDAGIVADAAAQAGFEVTTASDLTKADFEQALRDFRTKADGADVALIYYAGHGVESAGKNYLIPVDAKLADSRDLRLEAIELDLIMENLAKAQRQVIILDACRDSPFVTSWAGGQQTQQRGLAQSEMPGALIIYAATRGEVAVDGQGANSPFAEAIARWLPEPGLQLQLLGGKVTDAVVAATGGRQHPWTYSGLGGEDFFLVPGAQPSAPSLASARAATDDPRLLRAQMAYWHGAESQNTLEAYEDYLREYPDGFFVTTARTRIAALRQAGPRKPQQLAAASVAGQVSRTVSSPPAPPPKPAAAAPNPPPPAPRTANIFPQPSPPITGISSSPLDDGNHDLMPLPAMPPAPVFSNDAYPDCRESYQAVADPIGRVNEINRCLGLLADYATRVLNGFHVAMAAHKQEISDLYTKKVGGNAAYTPKSQKQFYDAMQQEFADSDPDGRHFADLRAAEARYNADFAYLKDRYCFSTGRCGGYPVPAGIAPAGK